MLLEAEDVGRALEGVGQCVCVVVIVVHVEAGACGGSDAEQAHQRLGAMMAGTDAHVVLIEDLADVVGMKVTEGEAEHAATDRQIAGTVDADVVTEALGERVDGVARQLDLVSPDGVHAETAP